MPVSQNSRQKKKLKLKEIINIIESVAPLSNQADWDNSGLQIGDKEASVSSVLLCTDVTDAVVKEAVEKGCELIVSHHPLLFHGVKTIQGQTMVERCVIMCIKHDIAVYSAHTSLDTVLHGISGTLADKLGVTNYHILEATNGDEVGYGVTGELEEPMPFGTFVHMVKDALGAAAVRYVEPKGGEQTMVKRVALCGGAGAEFMDKAVKAGADVYVSADWKHHELLEAVDKIGVLDVGHWESEQFAGEILASVLVEKDGLNVILAEADQSPVKAV